MRFHNNIGPQVRRRRYALGWSQSMLATNEIAGFDISRSTAPLRGRQRPHVRRRGIEGSHPGAFPAARKRRAPIRLHGEAGNDTVLTESRPRPGF
jgi:hypothetical protein